MPVTTPLPRPLLPVGEPSEAGASQEALLALRQELAERDDVMALVAHELRNPLHVLALQLSVARMTAQAHGQGETLSRIEKAQSTLTRYTDRVTVLLDLVSARGPHHPSRPQALDLKALLVSVIEHLTPDAKFRGVEVELVGPPACPAELDPLIVEQILDNLMLNAFKHAACSKVVVTLTVQDGWARMAVADNGRGVAPEDRDRIFGKFDVATRSGRGTGTGLGLWIVRRLSAALGGSVALECPAAGGCVFTLQCPLSPPQVLAGQ